MRDIRIEAQPDDDTCGATSLHAVYRHLGDDLPLEQVIDEIYRMEEGGTLAVILGIHALKRGYHARLFSYNLRVFDPTWKNLAPAALRTKLIAQTRYKDGKKLHAACLAYSRFLKEGGDIRFDDPSPELFHSFFAAGLPVLAGLSATYLYQSKREYADAKGRSIYHDLRGKPVGHFVVLSGAKGDLVRVSDPYQDNPMAEGRFYQVPMSRLINSVLLGIVTYDANLLIISKTPIAA